MLSNRDWAGVFWICVFVIWAAADRSLRDSLRPTLAGLLRQLLGPKILAPLVIGAIGVTGLVLILRSFQLWDTALVAETAIWFLLAAPALMLSLTNLENDPRFFTHKALRIVSVTGLLTGFANVFVFPIYVELVLAPLLALLAGIVVVAELNPRHAGVGRASGVVLALAAVAFLCYGAVELATGSDAAAESVGRALAAPIWLSLGWLAYLRVVAVPMTYEVTWLRIGLATDNAAAGRRSKLALLRECRLNVHDVASFGAPWIGRLVRARSMASARTIVRNFKHARRTRLQV